jgi:hypothetical protein
VVAIRRFDGTSDGVSSRQIVSLIGCYSFVTRFVSRFTGWQILSFYQRCSSAGLGKMEWFRASISQLCSVSVITLDLLPS